MALQLLFAQWYRKNNKLHAVRSEGVKDAVLRRRMIAWMREEHKSIQKSGCEGTHWSQNGPRMTEKRGNENDARCWHRCDISWTLERS